MRRPDSESEEPTTATGGALDVRFTSSITSESTSTCHAGVGMALWPAGANRE
jgi:hypothetical protein